MLWIYSICFSSSFCFVSHFVAFFFFRDTLPQRLTSPLRDRWRTLSEISGEWSGSMEFTPLWCSATWKRTERCVSVTNTNANLVWVNNYCFCLSSLLVCFNFKIVRSIFVSRSKIGSTNMTTVGLRHDCRAKIALLRKWLIDLFINIQSLLAAGAVWLNLGPPWRAEMQPNCPGYQERLCLSSWHRYSTRTGKARKNRTRRESFLARKNDRNFQPCDIPNISPRAEICNLTMARISWFSAGEASSGPKFKSTCEIAESHNVHPSIWLVSAMVTDMWHMIKFNLKRIGWWKLCEKIPS